ncbi:MAG: hypothetical protein NTY38_17175, partial [Acidobacteria bacterium]|nr:hypothetical protein [Acidobacteriota bacterium]
MAELEDFNQDEELTPVSEGEAPAVDGQESLPAEETAEAVAEVAAEAVADEVPESNKKWYIIHT